MRMRNFALWLLTAFFAFDASAAALKYGDVVTMQPDPARNKTNWYLTVSKDPNSDIREVKDVGDTEKWIFVNPSDPDSRDEIKAGEPLLIQSSSLKKYLVVALGYEIKTMSIPVKKGSRIRPRSVWEIEGGGSNVNEGEVISFKSKKVVFTSKGKKKAMGPGYLGGGHTGAFHPHDVRLAKNLGKNELWVSKKVGELGPAEADDAALTSSVTGPAEIQAPEVSAKVTLPAGFMPLVPGGLAGVAVGLTADGKSLILGRGEAGAIFRANIVEGKPVAWGKAIGDGVDIDVGSDGTMVAINKKGKPFVWDSSMRGWTSLHDADLIKIAVGKDAGDLWAVTKEGALVHLEDGQWVDKNDGQNKYVAAASDGTVAYIDAGNNVFVSYDSGATFNQIKNLKLDVISVARRNVMRGLFRDNLYWLTAKGHWLLAKKGRNLEDIAVGLDGTLVVITSIAAKKASGAPHGNAIFYREIKLPALKGPGVTSPMTEEVVVSTSEIEETVVGSTTGFPSSFFEIEGQPLRQVSVGVNADGTTAIWGVASDNKIYQGAYQPGSMGMGPTINWTENKAGLASRISVGRDIVLAVSPYHNVWRWNSEKGVWEKFSDQTGDFKMVAAADSNNIWAIKENGSIVRWVDEKWDPVNGNAIFIDVSTDGNKVVALNSAGTPFFRNKAGTDWEPLGQPQVFKEIYIGSDKLIRGISSDGHWMILENGNWTKSPITQSIMSGDIDAKSDVAVVTPENKVYFRQGTVVVAVATEVVAEVKPEDMTLEQRIATAFGIEGVKGRIESLVEVVDWTKDNNKVFEKGVEDNQNDFARKLSVLYSAIQATDEYTKGSQQLEPKLLDLLGRIIITPALIGSAYNTNYVNTQMIDPLVAKGIKRPSIEVQAKDVTGDLLKLVARDKDIEWRINSFKQISTLKTPFDFDDQIYFVWGCLFSLVNDVKALPETDDKEKAKKVELSKLVIAFLNTVKDDPTLVNGFAKNIQDQMIVGLPTAPAPVVVVPAPAAPVAPPTTPTETTQAIIAPRIIKGRR